jgi:hypothetical protein
VDEDSESEAACRTGRRLSQSHYEIALALRHFRCQNPSVPGTPVGNITVGFGGSKSQKGDERNWRGWLG